MSGEQYFMDHAAAPLVASLQSAALNSGEQLLQVISCISASSQDFLTMTMKLYLLYFFLSDLFNQVSRSLLSFA